MKTTSPLAEGAKAVHIPTYLACNNDTLRKATRNLGQLYDEAIAPTHLRGSQFGVLAHIDQMDEPTMKALAEELVLDLSALSRAVQPLIRDGYVRLVANLDDGRSKRVTLTKAGQRKVAEATALWLEAQRRFEAAFGVERAHALRETLLTLASEDFSQAFKASATRSAT